MDRIYMLVAALALLSGCVNGPQADISAGLGENFSLKINQSAYIQSAGMLISFVSVEQDSRCPRDVICVWEGAAVIGLKWQDPGSEGQFMNLNISTQEGKERITYDGEVYSIELVSLDPYPELEVPIAPDDYSATLRLTKG